MTPAQTAPAPAGTSKLAHMGDHPLSRAAEPGSLHALVLDSLDEDQALDVVSIPLEGKSSIADFMIIASGRSTRQVAAIATKLAERLKAAGHGTPRIEGLPAADWVLIDAGDVVVHLFRPEVRTFYNLERMWGFGDEPAVAAGSA
jgi:ribosome-associated protein